jgi:phosphatidylserine/phosphatidylglycerophosphate/cardiolipin synthase-like enzyme
MAPLDDGDYLFPGTPNITPTEQSLVTPLIDGIDYLVELSRAIHATSDSNDFIYIMGWTLALVPGEYQPTSLWPLSFTGAQVIEHMEIPPFPLFVPDASGVIDVGNDVRPLVDVLAEKAEAGVDVRVMGWVSYSGMSLAVIERFFFPLPALNAITINSIATLREKSSKIAATLNTAAHTGGACHAKLVVTGKGTQGVAFTGGLDLCQERFVPSTHPGGGGYWHDIMAKVEGLAAQGPYEFFKEAWHQNLSIPGKVFRFEHKDVPSFLPKTKVVPPRTLAPATSGTHIVQSLRTIPDYNYSALNCLPENPDVPSFPQGLFEVRAAWKHAISKAQDYIYLEDQALWSIDVMGWINERLRNSSVRVIIVTSGGSDPNDPDFPEQEYRHESINKSLLKDLNTEQRSRVRLFKLWGDTIPVGGDVVIPEIEPDGNGFVLHTPIVDNSQAIKSNDLAKGQRFFVFNEGIFRVVGNPKISKGAPWIVRVERVDPNSPPPQINRPTKHLVTIGLTVHAKVTIVDDKWAIIGSSNCMRRSLVTDWEHSVGFVAPNSNDVRDYRARLWNEHFRHDNPADFHDLQAALHSWEPTWGTAGSAPPIPPRLDVDPGPPYIQSYVPEVKPITPNAQQRYDFMDDNDSTQPYTGLCGMLRAKI